MTSLRLYFNNVTKDQHRVPYIIDEDTFEYKCDGKEGTVTFDGYYNVEDREPPYPEDDALERWERPMRHGVWLPQKLNLYVQWSEKEPYKVEKLESGGIRYEHKIVDEHGYIIEIYKRIKHASTNQYSEIDDGDDQSMRVCFFPTDRQTIYFRVLETL
jgi:hypothetical protein